MLDDFMLNNLIVAISAVVPIFVLMSIGAVIKWRRWLNEEELAHMNRMVFRVFFFCMMFYSLYTSDPSNSLRPRLMLFGVCGVLTVFALSMWLVPKVEPENRRRGVIVQALFRSNFVLMGVPIVANIFGDQNIAVATAMIAVIIPMYNILGVVALETFRGGSFKLMPIFVEVMKNPMILGAIAGALCMLAGIKIPAPVLKPIGQISAATTPVALLILGASFKLGATHEHRRQLIGAVTGRLIVVPGILLAIAIALGFRGVELVTLIGTFCTPCAVVSYAMAQQLGGDAELAGSCVVFSSAFACLTIFCWIFLFKTLGFF